MSQFFINRPIFACVLAIVIVIAGAVTINALPVEQYPQISPPTVRVSTSYPGANAKIVSDTVAAPIEQEVNGVEGMMYMSSTCANDGSYALTVTFDLGVDLDMANVLVQNRVSIAQAKLPEEVKRQGVTTKKQSTNIVLMMTLTSTDPKRFDGNFLSNFATLNIRDELTRLEGVGDVTVFGGADYSMRIWLNPDALKQRNLSPDDVVNAIREQNIQVAAGQIGQPPAPAGQSFQYTINLLGRLTKDEEFRDIIVKQDGGRITRVGDVARVERGAKNYSSLAEQNGQPAAAIAVYQLPGANSLKVAELVEAKMEELKARFPKEVSYDIPFDTTRFVEASIEEVYETLFIAAGLVILTIFVFLQDWRSTIIPTVTIPVSLIGTFAVMMGLGFSINMLSLFGLVLAIGIVVDDAIVVVENTARHIDNGMAPRPAAILAMQEVTGPVVATTLVLLAVFVPSAFLPGITGQLYRQFALTIAASTIFSSINALTLSPALCAIVLKPSDAPKGALFQVVFGWFFKLFNIGFDKSSSIYVWMVSRATRMAMIMMVLFFGLSFLGAYGFTKLPTGFVPTEDQGYMMISIQLPDAASLERTENVANQVAKFLQERSDVEGGIDSYITITGYSLLDGSFASNTATLWVMFRPWGERTTPELKQEQILASLRKDFMKIQDGVVFGFLPPAISGLGVSGGFQMQILDKGGVGYEALQDTTNELILAGNGQRNLTSLNSTFRANVPQLFVDIDREKTKVLDVPLSNVFSALQSYLGSSYVNDYNDLGRVFQVYVQADSPFRNNPGDIELLEVRDNAGNMVPIGTLADISWTVGPQIVNRYNMYPTASITGEASAGVSSGQALTIMEQMATSELPQSMGYDWTGMSYQEKKVGSEAIVIFALAIVLVYLVLAAQYESWTIPAAVIFAVPLALLGTVLAVAARGMDNNVYTQIGIVLLVALASKNAILIVEFAREIRNKGTGIIDSAVEASRLRFRPILMTAFSFILGVIPLVVASGAGAASRQALGTAVCGGMSAATILAVFFVPVFFVVFQSISEIFSPVSTEDSPPPITAESTSSPEFVIGSDATETRRPSGGTAAPPVDDPDEPDTPQLDE